jgi:phage FluMu gp28-like protein
MRKLVAEFPELHGGGQSEIFQDTSRFKAVCTGRRWGKTIGEAVKLYICALQKPKEAEALFAWVSPFYKITSVAFRYMSNPNRFPRAPRGFVKSVNKSEPSITLINGARIEFGSTDNPDSLLGKGYDGVVIDEAARVEERAWTEIIQPALVDRRGWCDFISTPRGKNWFYDLWQRGQGDSGEYKSFRFSSYDNPYLDPELLDSLKSSMSAQMFRQEILAEFLDEGLGVFANVTSCKRGNLIKQGAPNDTYCLGVDLAKTKDWTVLCVVSDDGVLVYFERIQLRDYPSQVERIAEIAARFNNAMVIVDSTGVGDPVYDYLLKKQLNLFGYKFTNESKANLIHNLQLAFEREIISIPDAPELAVLFSELGDFAYEITPAGLTRYNAPTGKHDDCVIALALAIWGVAYVNSRKPAYDVLPSEPKIRLAR